MDSEDNPKNFYSDKTNSESDNGEDVYVFSAANNFDNDNTATSSCHKVNYKILSKADIQRLQEDDVLQLSNFLCISSVEASVLLCSYSCNSEKLQDEWFVDEHHVRCTVGLLRFPAEDAENRNKLVRTTCNICFELHLCRDTSAAFCGHHFCDDCWQGYMASSIRKGLSCLTLRCPDPYCFAAVGQAMVNRLASNEDKEKYLHFLLQSYVEGSRSIKWCPSPSCEFAVQFEVGCTNYDIYCRCSYQFCWNCAKEAHRPIDCKTMDEWMSKTNDEARNIVWILANSKPCPKCKRPIEKNQGCMHMVCIPPCEHHFCWICLGDWEEHDVQNGGFYYCNRFERTKKVGEEDEFQRRKKMTKISIEMYNHYYVRWAVNHLSWKKALVDLQRLKDEKLENLHRRQNETSAQVEFVIEAWEQIVECRRMLKWTYAYGYYLPEDEHDKRQFFEYLQGEAEAGLERLHQCAERELQVYLCASARPSQEFSNFRSKLIDLTSVTRSYFKNFVGALEKGLQDVACSYKGSTKTTDVQCATC